VNRRRLLALAAGTAAALATAGTARAFHRDLARARARLHGRSVLVPTRAGAMEYAEAGQGPPVLMIHGTGGGFDQGLAFAHGLAEAGWRVIAPSRFGYLRSAFPADASSEAQADAFLDLLDALGLDRVPVVGGSAGALPAMAFAIRHPDRCAALAALVPAAFAPGRPAPRPPNPVAAAIIEHGLRSDLLFWLGMTLAEDAMIAALLATDPALVHAAGAAEQARVRAILRGILPVSARARGLLNDARLAGDPQPMPLERIAAPTLALSLDDDRFETLAAARHLAASVPGARLVSWPVGGHVWVGLDATVTAELDAFLRSVA
jgi:2-hydroxy-6-oxonona-2,4-dienedioate hydrolase